MRGDCRRMISVCQTGGHVSFLLVTQKPPRPHGPPRGASPFGCQLLPWDVGLGLRVCAPCLPADLPPSRSRGAAEGCVPAVSGLCPSGTLGTVSGHSGLSQHGGSYWHLEGRSWGAAHPQAKKYPSKVSVVPRLRNPGLACKGKGALGRGNSTVRARCC